MQYPSGPVGTCVEVGDRVQFGLAPIQLSQNFQRDTMQRRHIQFLLAILVLCGLAASPAYAAKTDIVVLINGNAVTGEVKSLEFGALSYGTDSMGTVSIDWEDVVSLTSNQSLQVEVTDGRRFFGHLTTPDDRQTIRIKGARRESDFPMDEIIRITPIETDEKIWQRLEGSVSLGFQTQKSSGVTTSNISADVRYRTRDYLLGLQLSSSVTDQPTLDTTARQSIQGNYQRFKANRWFTDWFSGWERNDELGIQSRTSLGGALGRYFVQTNQNQFSTTLGIQAAREVFTGSTESTTNLEGRLEFRYLRRHLSPETTITFTSKIFPLLEDLSVIRAETDLIFRREFIADLFFDVSIGHSYQSDPPDGAEKVDYAVTTSLGYSF